MNMPNFALMQLNAQERHQAILRQAQQDQLLATLERNAGLRLPFSGVGLWLRNIRSALTGTAPKGLAKRTLVRSGSVS